MPIDSTLLGITMFSSCVNKNIPVSILFNPSVKVTDFKLERSDPEVKGASALVTFAGIMILSREVH